MNTKQKAQHTAGEWRVLPDDGHGLAIAPKKPQGHCIGAIYQSNPNAESDARLIASAPELLEALEQAQSYILRNCKKSIRDSEKFSISATMASAIAKAKGLDQ